MYTFLIIIHLFVSFIMIAAILLQSGKGAEIGAAFGGSSQTIFGSRGAATFLSKMTVGAAIIFMVTSLSLAFLSKERAGENSIMKLPKTETVPSPAPPASPATATAPAGTPGMPQPVGTSPLPAGNPAAPKVETTPNTVPEKK
ncbi:MAG: preprotein translocase subunit SecG [Nitrospiria bacterium]